MGLKVRNLTSRTCVPRQYHYEIILSTEIDCHFNQETLPGEVAYLSVSLAIPSKGGNTVVMLSQVPSARKPILFHKLHFPGASTKNPSESKAYAK